MNIDVDPSKDELLKLNDNFANQRDTVSTEETATEE